MATRSKPKPKDASSDQVINVNLEASDKQLELLNSDAETIVYQGGAGSGKTYGGILWAMLRALEWGGSRGMIVAASYSMMKQSALVHLLTLAEQLCIIRSGDKRAQWQFNRSDMQIVMPWNGSTVWLRSSDRPESLLGADLAWMYGDEVALWHPDAYRYSVSRLRQPGYQQQACFTFTPKGLNNWAYGVFGQERDGLHVIRTTTYDNPWAGGRYLTRLERELGKGSKFFLQEVMGEYVSFEGLIYPSFDQLKMVITDDPPPMVALAVGVDWGWTQPGVMILLGLDAAGNVWALDEVWACQQMPEWWVDQGKGWRDRYGRSLPFACDPESPANIETFNRAGLKAHRANNEVETRIAAIGGRFHNGTLFITARCPHLISELLAYSYKPKPRGADGYSNEPLKINDHCCDAIGYGILDLLGKKKQWWQNKEFVKRLTGGDQNDDAAREQLASQIEAALYQG